MEVLGTEDRPLSTTLPPLQLAFGSRLLAAETQATAKHEKHPATRLGYSNLSLPLDTYESNFTLPKLNIVLFTV